MLYFFYNFVWGLIFIFLLPVFYLSGSTGIARRLGLGLPETRRKEKTIWVHALSVGEVISSLPLVDGIRKKYPSKNIIFTVKTAQGMEVARNRLADKVDCILPMPVDFQRPIKRLINHINPAVLILIETDIWPCLLSSVKKKGGAAILVNGRISPRTFKLYKRFRFFTRRLFRHLDLCLMQSPLDRERFVDTGTISPEKIIDAGNIKFDMPWKPMDEEEGYWTKELYLRPENMVWVAGSTHGKENEIILKTFKGLRALFPGLVLLVAPRRLEEAEDIFKTSMQLGLNTIRRTDRNVKRDQIYDVLVLNSVGELGRIYGIADVSFVGGSMVPFGGHNLLEPACFGCPVVFGEHTFNFVAMSRLIIDAGGGKRVRDEDELFTCIRELLSNRDRARNMGTKAKEFVEKNSGALDRVMEHIGSYV